MHCLPFSALADLPGRESAVGIHQIDEPLSFVSGGTCAMFHAPTVSEALEQLVRFWRSMGMNQELRGSSPDPTVS